MAPQKKRAWTERLKKKEHMSDDFFFNSFWLTAHVPFKIPLVNYTSIQPTLGADNNRYTSSLIRLKISLVGVILLSVVLCMQPFGRALLMWVRRNCPS